MKIRQLERRIKRVRPASSQAEMRPQAKRCRDRDAKQRALLAAATKLFASQGFEATTTREIAAHAGCAEGLIHRYFTGKEGLLIALIKRRVSDEVSDLKVRMPLAAKFADEFFQMVDWELERMWEDRDFLRVIIPRALVDAEVGKVLSRVGTSRHSEAIVARLQNFKEGASMGSNQLQAFARLIRLLGFEYGFFGPVVLGQARGQCRIMAHAIGELFLGRCKRNS